MKIEKKLIKELVEYLDEFKLSDIEYGNNDLKIRLSNAKQQLASFESNKLDLKSALDHLNKVLSRNSVVDTLNTTNNPKDSEKEKNSQLTKKD